jgi:hypothetical protein
VQSGKLVSHLGITSQLLGTANKFSQGFYRHLQHS